MTVKWLGSDTKPHDNYWLTVGRVYDVLSIWVDKGGVFLRLIENDSRTPALHALDEFEIVSVSIPSN